MQFPSALTNRDPQQRRKQSQSEKRKGQRLSGDLWSSLRAQAAGQCSPRFRPWVSGKQKDSETRLHLSHLGGVDVFICVIFLFPSPLSRELCSVSENACFLLPLGSRTLGQNTKRRSFYSSQIPSHSFYPTPEFRVLIHFEFVIVLRGKRVGNR